MVRVALSSSSRSTLRECAPSTRSRIEAAPLDCGGRTRPAPQGGAGRADPRLFRLDCSRSALHLEVERARQEARAGAGPIKDEDPHAVRVGRVSIDHRESSLLSRPRGPDHRVPVWLPFATRGPRSRGAAAVGQGKRARGKRLGALPFSDCRSGQDLPAASPARKPPAGPVTCIIAVRQAGLLLVVVGVVAVLLALLADPLGIGAGGFGWVQVLVLVVGLVLVVVGAVLPSRVPSSRAEDRGEAR